MSQNTFYWNPNNREHPYSCGAKHVPWEASCPDCVRIEQNMKAIRVWLEPEKDEIDWGRTIALGIIGGLLFSVIVKVAIELLTTLQ